MSAYHVRRDKAARFQWVQGPPGDSPTTYAIAVADHRLMALAVLRENWLQTGRLTRERHRLTALDAPSPLFGGSEFFGGYRDERFALGDHLAGTVAQRVVCLDDPLGLGEHHSPRGLVLLGGLELQRADLVLRGHWQTKVHGVEDLGLGFAVEAVAKSAEALMQPDPEVEPLGCSWVRKDATEARDMLVTNLAALATGVDKAEPQPAR
jgi:hypothetical protein